jgi:hypothetical protein
MFSGQQLETARAALSVRSVWRCYKQGIWSNELVVGQLPVGKNVRRKQRTSLVSDTRQRLVKTQQIEKT